MEKYYKIKKEIAERSGFNNLLRTEVDDCLLLTEIDIRNINITMAEKIKALGGVLYTNESEPGEAPENDVESENNDE